MPSRVFILNEGSQDMADMLFNLETNQNRIDLTPTDWLKYVDLYMDEKIDNVDATCSTSKDYAKSGEILSFNKPVLLAGLKNFES